MFDSRSGWGDGQTRKDCDRVTSVMKKIKQENEMGYENDCPVKEALSKR